LGLAKELTDIPRKAAGRFVALLRYETSMSPPTGYIRLDKADQCQYTFRKSHFTPDLFGHAPLHPRADGRGVCSPELTSHDEGYAQTLLHKRAWIKVQNAKTEPCSRTYFLTLAPTTVTIIMGIRQTLKSSVVVPG